MIRGHPTVVNPEDGYQLHFEDNCWTVSSATACPTVVFLDPGKELHCCGPNPIEDVPPTIRFVQLDPSTDSSST